MELRTLVDYHEDLPDEEQAVLGAAALEDVVFTGDRLRELANRDPLPPVYPGVPPRGHFSLLIGPSFAGKTTEAVWIGMARAAGCAPWIGAPEIEPGRTLIVSPDEPVEQMARQILRLAHTHPGGRTFDYCSMIDVVGLDASIPMHALAAFKFDAEGFAVLDSLIESRSVAAVVLDAYADMLPAGASEQDNETASAIGGQLEGLAVHHGIPITVIHHVGKTGGRSTAEIDVRDLGRGASALAAKARCIFTFEEVDDFPQTRRIRTRTNLTQGPAPLDLEVTERGSIGAGISYLRPLDPATAYPIDETITQGEDWISTSELARRLSGQAEGKPGGQAVSMARTVRSIWLGAGLIECQKGARNATEIRRIR